jgi:hypothetical protein
MRSQAEDVPNHLFTFLDDDPTYPIELGALVVALGGFKALHILIYDHPGLDF